MASPFTDTWVALLPGIFKGGLTNKFTSVSSYPGLTIIGNNFEILMRNSESDNGKISITTKNMRNRNLDY